MARRASPTFVDGLICEACHTPCVRTGPTQRYCEPCSAAKDRERKRDFARTHPPDRQLTLEAQRERQSERVEQGAERSLGNRIGIGWMADSDPDIARLVRVSMPFSYEMSKNAIWSVANKQGHVYARRQSNARRRELAQRVLLASRDGEWFEGKVWIDILVEKPDARGDAINVIDLVCDALKDVLGVDDRWYSIRRLDWAIVKRDPMLYVGIGQEVTEHHRICSHCGSCLPLREFTKNRSMPRGYGRVCRTCARTRR